jgi:hypothetical protein
VTAYSAGALAASRFWHVNFCTYADLAGGGEAVAAFVDRALELANRLDLPLRITLDRTLRPRPKRGRRLGGSAWPAARDALVRGEATYLFVFDDTEAATTMPAHRPLGFSLSIQNLNLFDSIAENVQDAAALEQLRTREATPRFVNFAVRADAIAPEPPSLEIGPAIDAAQRAFTATDGACGFASVDAFAQVDGSLTQYEADRRVYWASEPALYRTKLRGAFWGNLLSPAHVAALGGFDAVERDAPCALVRPLAFPSGGEGAYLQLTERPEDAAEAPVSELARYLVPLLP